MFNQHVLRRIIALYKKCEVTFFQSDYVKYRLTYYH